MFPNPFESFVNIGNTVTPAAKKDSRELPPCAEKVFLPRTYASNAECHAIRDVQVDMLRVERLRRQIAVHISGFAEEPAVPLIVCKEHFNVEKRSR